MTTEQKISINGLSFRSGGCGDVLGGIDRGVDRGVDHSSDAGTFLTKNPVFNAFR